LGKKKKTMPMKLASRREGDGPPIVVLHGLFGSARNWASVSKALAAQFQVHSLDLRNHGGSPWSDEMNYPDMAEDVAAFLDQEGLKTAVVLGHSMGGKVAMTLALTRPERVSALAVVDIAPAIYRGTLEVYAQAMMSLDLAQVSRRGEVDAMLAESVPEAGIRAFLLQNLERADGGFVWRLNLPALLSAVEQLGGFPASLGGATYHAPTCFIAGGLSDYLRPEHAPLVDALFPNAEIRRIAGAGHWVHAEQPQAFLETLGPFLAQAAATMD
jgi:pimeloyl-ACP methyl ester carboxylesterase